MGSTLHTPNSMTVFSSFRHFNENPCMGHMRCCNIICSHLTQLMPISLSFSTRSAPCLPYHHGSFRPSVAHLTPSHTIWVAMQSWLSMESVGLKNAVHIFRHCVAPSSWNMNEFCSEHLYIAASIRSPCK